MRFRKKPIVIEADRWDGTQACWDAHFHQHGYIMKMTGGPEAGRALLIQTLEGTMIANPGDWVIKGVKGEFYPCKPDIFAATYEAVEEPGEDRDSRGILRDEDYGNASSCAG
jgi:hypothetical protein